MSKSIHIGQIPIPFYLTPHMLNFVVDSGNDSDWQEQLNISGSGYLFQIAALYNRSNSTNRYGVAPIRITIDGETAYERDINYLRNSIYRSLSLKEIAGSFRFEQSLKIDAKRVTDSQIRNTLGTIVYGLDRFN